MTLVTGKFMMFKWKVLIFKLFMPLKLLILLPSIRIRKQFLKNVLQYQKNIFIFASAKIKKMLRITLYQNCKADFSEVLLHTTRGMRFI